MIRLGVVGSGMISGEAIPLFKKLGYQLTALCSTPRSFEKARGWCKEYEIEACFCDYEEFLKSNIDTVYLGIPNDLHYAYAKKALEAGKHVILEKPFCSNFKEAKELAALSEEKGLFLLEAISTLYLPAYQKTREWLPLIGRVRLVACNFSQYSSRYDNFMKGIIAPAFDPAHAGGALMDLNIYNLHYLTGLFGAPEKISYQANVDRGIDTSGVLSLVYPDFQAVSIAAKDCGAPCSYAIQGTLGTITMTNPANAMTKVSLNLRDGRCESFDAASALSEGMEMEVPHRMEAEFASFKKVIEDRDFETARAALAHTLQIMDLLTRARESAGVKYPWE